MNYTLTIVKNRYDNKIPWIRINSEILAEFEKKCSAKKIDVSDVVRQFVYDVNKNKLSLNSFGIGYFSNYDTMFNQVRIESDEWKEFKKLCVLTGVKSSAVIRNFISEVSKGNIKIAVQ